MRRPALNLLLPALIVLGCSAAPRTAGADNPLLTEASSTGSTRTGLRVMTYNIHVGREGIDNVASVIRKVNPDIVGLQEVDRFTTRLGSRGTDQLAQLSEATGLPYTAYFKATHFYGGEYGVAIMSRYPIGETSQLGLPTENSEPRTAGRALVQTPQGDVAVYVTHLTNLPIRSKLRVQQVRHLLSWMAKDEVPQLVMGDLNDSVNSAPVKLLKSRFTELFGRAGRGPDHTYPSSILPNGRFDYIFASPSLAAKDAYVVHAKASDHYPVVADIAQPAALAQTGDASDQAPRAAAP